MYFRLFSKLFLRLLFTEMHHHVCYPVPGHHNLPIACDKPTSIVSRGGRSDRTPVRLHIEPLFTYDYICNQYSKKWHKWQGDSIKINPSEHSQSQLNNATVVNVDEYAESMGSMGRRSASSTQSVRTSESKSLLRRFIRSVIWRAARKQLSDS